jgi:hypothetical protein
MKTCTLLAVSLTVLSALSPCIVLSADDEPKPPQPRPSREELREKFKNLTPEERQAKLRESRERQAGTNRVDLEKRRQEFQKFQDEVKNLPPAERQAKIKEWRQKQGLAQPDFRTLNPGQAKAKRGELKKRVEQQLGELRKKKSDGTITEQESKRLERMELMTKRLDEGEGSAQQDAGTLPPPAVPAKPAKPPGGQ